MVAKEKGVVEDTEPSDVMVVVVRNYQGPPMVPDTPSPSVKSETPAPPEVKEKKEAAEGEEKVDEKDRAVDEAIKAVVAEWQQKENDVNCNDSKSDHVDSDNSKDGTVAEGQEGKRIEVNSNLSDPEKTEEVKVPVEGEDDVETVKPSEPDPDKTECQQEENQDPSEAEIMAVDDDEEEEVDDAVAVAEEETEGGEQK